MWKGWIGTCFDVKWQKWKSLNDFFSLSAVSPTGPPIAPAMLVSGATSAGTAGATCSLLPVITGDPAETIQKVAASANCGKIISIYEYNLQLSSSSCRSTETNRFWADSIVSHLKTPKRNAPPDAFVRKRKAAKMKALVFFFRKPTLVPSGSHGPLSSMIDLSKNQNMINIDKYI